MALSTARRARLEGELAVRGIRFRKGMGYWNCSCAVRIFWHWLPSHCEASPADVAETQMFWWHIQCGAKLPPRLKYTGHDCPCCGVHRSAASKTGTALFNRREWFYGSYDDFKKQPMCISCLDLEKEDGTDYCDECNFQSTIADVSENVALSLDDFSPVSCAESCSVCLEEIKTKIVFNCSHSMCLPCFSQWTALNSTCHMCRGLIKPCAAALQPKCKFCDCVMSEKRNNKDVCNRCCDCSFCGIHKRDMHSSNKCVACFIKAQLAYEDVKRMMCDLDRDLCEVEKMLEKPEPMFSCLAPVKERKRGKRAGKSVAARSLQFSHGLCYTKLVPVRYVRKMTELGAFPTVTQVCEKAVDLSVPLVVPNHQLTLADDGRMHVRRRRGNDPTDQLAWLTENVPDREVGSYGSMVEDFGFTSLEGVVKEGFQFIEGIEGSYLQAVEENLRENPLPEMNLEAKFPAPAEVPAAVERHREVRVGGPGDCWKILPGLPAMWYDRHGRVRCKDNSFYMTLNELFKIAKPVMTPSSFNVYSIKWSRQSDGDLHIDEVKKGLFPRDPSYIPSYKWWSLMLKEKREILVGKDDTSDLDGALQRMTNPEIQRTVQSLFQNDMTIARNEINELCPWAIPIAVRHRMNELSIPWSNMSSRTHPHPVHNATRRWLCKQALPKNIHSDVTIVGCSQANAQWIRDALTAQGKKHAVHVVNPILDLKDPGRYLENRSTVPTDITKLPEIKTKTAVLFDSGHYLKEGGMLRLSIENPEVEVWLVSSIYPLDALVSNSSTRPELYEFKIEGDTMIYIPEGDDGGRYEQPADPGMLLCKSITSDCGKYALEGGVIESKLTTHLMFWSKFHLATYKHLPLRIPLMMPLVRVMRGMRHDLGVVRVDDYINLVLYAKTLLNVREQDYWAKLRMQVDRDAAWCPISVRAHLVKTVDAVAKMQLVPDLQSKAYNSFSGEVYYKTVGHFVRWYDQAFKTRYAKRMARLVDEPHPIITFPLANAKVLWKCDTAYELRWHFDEALKGGWWDSVKFWGSRLIGFPPHEKSEFALIDGELSIDKTLPLTRRYVRTHGVDMIRATQVARFWMAFDPKRLKDERRHVPELPEAFVPNDNESEISTKVGSWCSKKKEDSDVSSVQSVSSDSTDPSSVDETPVCPYANGRAEKDEDCANKGAFGCPCKQRSDGYREACYGCSEFEDGRLKVQTTSRPCVADSTRMMTFAAQHCPDCPTFIEWEVAYDNTYANYLLWCDEKHSVQKINMSEAFKQMMYAKMNERYCLLDERRIGIQKPEPKAGEGLVQDDVENLPLDRKDGDSGEPLKAGPPLKSWNPLPKIVESSEEEIEDRAEKWRLMQLKRPMHVPIPNLTGVALWDYLFPDTVDRRVNTVPFLPVRSYVNTVYPKMDCLLVAIGDLVAKDPVTVWFDVQKALPVDAITADTLTTDVLETACFKYGLRCSVYSPSYELKAVCGLINGTNVTMIHDDGGVGHFAAGQVRPRMMIRELKVPSGMPTKAMKLVDELSKLPMVQWCDWTPSPSRGQAFVRAMLAKTTGTIGLQPLNESSLKAWEDQCDLMSKQTYERKMCLVQGSPGCRKSSGIQRILSDLHWHDSSCFSNINATNTLREDWSKKINVMQKLKMTKKGTPAEYCTTYETALIKQQWGWICVFDEDKYPKGYFDLFAFLFPWVRYFIVLGDLYQSQRHEPNEKCLLNDPSVLGNCEFLTRSLNPPKPLMYLHGTWRFGPNIANFFRLPTFSSHPGSMHFTQESITTVDCLRKFFPGHHIDDLNRMWVTRDTYVPSHAAKAWNEELKGREADTFAGSQGLSCELAIIEIDARTLRLSDPRIIFTVMSRAQYIIFHLAIPMTGEHRQVIANNPIWSHLFYYEATYTPGKIVKIHPAHTIDLFDPYLISPFPDHFQKTLAGPPEKVTNMAFVKPYMDYDYKVHYIDPDAYKKKISGGGRLRLDDPVYLDAHQFRPFIEIWQHEKPPDALVPEYTAPVRKITTHVPPHDKEQVEEIHMAQAREKFASELRYNGMYSDQKIDLPRVRADVSKVRARLKKQMWPKMSAKQAERSLQQWLRECFYYDDPTLTSPFAGYLGQWQSTKDSASFAAGVKQRIRYKTREENVLDYDRTYLYGTALWAAMCKYLQWDPGEEQRFDLTAYEESVIIFQTRRGERSEALKKGSLNRADPLYDNFLTAKNQWKMKDLEFPVAKPLQTLLVRGDEYVMKFGPWGVYLLEKMLNDLPPYFYMHAKKSVSDLRDWVAVHGTYGEHEICDISALDTTVKGEGVVLIEKLMIRYGVPLDVVAAYREDKMDFHTRNLHFAIMTFSGEIFTWLVNSVDTVAKECLKFDIPPGWPMMNSGDDIERKAGLPVSQEWAQWEAVEDRVEKREVSDVGSFCSFTIKRGIVYKDPVLLVKRLCGKIAMGSIDDVALGYFEMFAFNYALGDIIYDVMTQTELMHMSVLNRIMFNLHSFGFKSKVDWSKVKISEYDRVQVDVKFMSEVVTHLSEDYEYITSLSQEPIVPSYTDMLSYLSY
jgi:hypothetical protein